MKKILSIILTFAMLFTLVFNVSAEDEFTMTGISALKDEVKITFSHDISEFTDEFIKEYTVILDEDDNEIDFEIASKEGNILTLSMENPDSEKKYMIYIYAGFGNDSCYLTETVVEEIAFLKLGMVDFYAGVGSVTVKYNSDITLADVGAIELAKANGAKIEHTASVKGNVLTIIPAESFVRDTEEYKVTIGDTVKNFKLKTVWEPETDYATGTIEGFKTNKGNGMELGVTEDGQIAVKGNQTALYPDFNTNTDLYKNASLSYDVIYPESNIGAAVGFNAANQTSGWMTYGSKTEGKTAYMWHTKTWGNGITHQKLYRDAANDVFALANPTTNLAPETTMVLGRMSTTVTITDGKASIGKDLSTATKYSYSVDKVGSFGTLVVNNQLIDRFNADDYMPENGKASENGYFLMVVEANSVILSNMAITVCEIVPGDATVTDIVEYYAGPGSITVTYGSEIGDIFNVGKIKLEERNGKVINTTSYVKGNVLTIVPAETLKRDTVEYKVTVGNRAKFFKLKTVWEPKTNYEEGTVEGFKKANGNGSNLGVTADGSIAYQANQGALYPDIDTNREEYKNASLSYDIIYTSWNIKNAVGFNANSNANGYMTYGTTAGTKTAYMWSSKNYSGGYNHQKIYRDAANNVCALTNPTAGLEAETDYSLSVCGASVTFTDGKASFNKDIASAKKYSYSVDKVGSFGTLIVDNNLIDRFEADDYMPEGGKASEYGYFLYAIEDAYTVVFSNMAITVMEKVAGEPTVENIIDFNAGVGSVTVKYDQEFDLEDLGAITLSDSKGNTINTEKHIKGNVLTLIPAKRFTKDTETYKLVIGNNVKKFKIKTIWEPETDYESGTVTGFKTAKGNGLTMGVTEDGMIAITGNQSAIYPDINTNSAEYKNASLSYDIIYPDKDICSAVGFNVAKNTEGYMTYIGTNAANTKTAYMWHTKTWGGGKYNQRLYRDGATGVYQLANPTAGLEAEVNYTLAKLSTTITYENGKAIVEDKVKDAEPYHYSVDKLGASATLVIDNQLIDRFNTQDYMPAGATAPEYGYFMFVIEACPIILSNVAITVCEEVAGSIAVKNVTCFGADGEVLENVAGKTDVSGQVTVINDYNENKPVKIVVVAYNGKKMLDIDVFEATSIDGNDEVTEDYSFAGLEGLTEIKVLVWDNLGNMYPYIPAVSSNK